MGTADLLSNLRIMLVDDEPFVRKVTTKVLSSLGIHHVIEAENGNDALEQLTKYEVGLLITDIQMPNMNGVELIKQIRMGKASCDRDLRVIVATSFSNTEVLSSCLALNINGFLVKPVAPVSAKEKIQLALSEQTSLSDKDVYRGVNTNLETLGELRKNRDRKRVRASISIEPRERSASGSRLVTLRNLQPGMILQENLYARRGVKLLSAGQVMDEGLINRIQELSAVIDTMQIRVRL